MTVAVIGGAGYIGAHVVRALTARGEAVVVVDDLSTGATSRLGGHRVHVLNIASEGAEAGLSGLFREDGVDAVVHLAAKKQVGESVERPLWYYRQNVVGTENVLRAAVQAGVRDVVFSSSAAVYGSPAQSYVSEETPARPINPYGETKLVGEWLSAGSARARGLRTTALRYFNVAGTASARLVDQGTFNLIPIVMQRLRAGRPVQIYGDDYPTPDGTCVRDYVHVVDLANAHLAALDAMRSAEGGSHRVYNVGTGTGFSVREVVNVVASVSGREVTTETVPRRAGDPPALTAAVGRIHAELGWKAALDLEDMVRSAWDAGEAAR